MLAVSLDNFKVLIVDLEGKRVVRSFSGHTNTVTDMVSSMHVFTKFHNFILSNVSCFVPHHICT